MRQAGFAGTGLHHPHAVLFGKLEVFSGRRGMTNPESGAALARFDQAAHDLLG